MRVGVVRSLALGALCAAACAVPRAPDPRDWPLHGRSADEQRYSPLAGSIPDLRYSPAEVHAHWAEIVVGGSRAELGMPGFGDKLTAADARLVQAYVLDLAAAAAAEAAAESE